ncbi:hypothetical protein AK812_SmicGene29727 [Symbiodinium microadriaticum]|uniref:Endonuclease/exonuclease/phosphatase domain-containing protein n=1 Tax=Symbiodinium microadriaticum TaxID=2951 RepID=A0A1Q9D136_SYMMI|nr:hypothetical protein AK812_SmicGene29727 [Symbiodinium microadriaticum]CAE7287001.1 unnamed protein product [Symbiodinium microadriaticum]CAE7309825.1 unnamed protein product [Symbiodinium sp. KB8]
MPGLPWIPYDALLMLLLPLCLSGIAFGLGCAMATVDQPLMMQHIPCPCLVHACLFDATPCPELQLRTRSNYRAQDQQELAATEWSNMADEGTSDDMVTVEVESPSPTRPSTSRAREASSETEPVIPAAPAPPGGRLEVREPAGPPPPRPIQELWQISTAISAVARTMADHSGVEPERVVTHLPHFWPSFRSVAVHVQAMPHADADHPNLLICSDEAPEEPEEPASKTEGAPTAAAHHPAPAAARTTEAETSDAGAPADVDASAADMSSPAEIRARWARLSPGGWAPPLAGLEAYQQFSLAHTWAKPDGDWRHTSRTTAGESEAGRPVDICVLQETAWRNDQEFSTNHQAANSTDWHIVHSAGPERSGILCMIRTGLLPSDSIRTACLQPGRLLHLRLLLQVPVDCLLVYQQAWNPQRADLRGTNKTAALLKQRRAIWTQVDDWLRRIPSRHGCLVIGDLNVSLNTEDSICGSGVPGDTASPHPDQGDIMDVLRAHRACALNTWGRPGPPSRTFLPPHSTTEKQGTQIDYIIAKGHMIDTVAKQAVAFDAPFVPTNGCRHRPVSAYVPCPRKVHRQPVKSRLTANQVGSMLEKPGFKENLSQHITQATTYDQLNQSVDEILIQGWRRARSTYQERRTPAGTPDAPAIDLEQPLTQYVHSMWIIRHRLRQHGQELSQWRRQGPEARRLFHAWSLTTILQRHTRAFRKACWRKKTQQVAAVVQASNIHQAAKRFAPKNPRRRLQLRDAQRHLQTHEAEFVQITEYYTS